MIEPWEQLLDAVLQIVHPDMHVANINARAKLLGSLCIPRLTWPTCYSGMDIIVNRITPPHCDAGGAYSFYSNLLSLGIGHDAQFCLDDLEAQFDYSPGTGIWFSGHGLHHLVPSWTKGERVVVSHYAKDDVHDHLEIQRPSLPTQAGWYSRYPLT